MKTIITLLSAFLLILVSCDINEGDNNNRNDGYKESIGTIFNADARACVCCGGWFVKIENDTFRLMTLPDNIIEHIDTAGYPVNVRLSWRRQQEGCGLNMKEIIEAKYILID